MRSLQEISFRLGQEGRNLLLRFFPPSLPTGVLPTSPVPFLPDPSFAVAQLSGTAFAENCVQIAEQILKRRFPILGIEVQTDSRIHWRRDYVSGIETPPDYFRRIPYLNPARSGDHKIVWELNRHQHLVLLAQAWCLTGRREFLQDISAQLETWFEDNPFQRGINFASALEVAFRSLSWIWIYHLAGNDLPAPCRAKLLSWMYLHGEHLSTNLSFYFSPNTHLLGEAVALHALGKLFESTKRGKEWVSAGSRVVQEQWDRQVHADGSYFEQSTYYHVYALDMFLFDGLLGGPKLVNREGLTRMAHFLDVLIPEGGTLPHLGDDDGGRFFHPYGTRSGFGLATLATCGILLNRPRWIRSKQYLAEQAFWWLPEQSFATEPASRADGGPRQSEQFKESGLLVMRSAETHIVFDGGGFGPYSGGHSHADALSLVVHHHGEEILIDPGTYLYLGDSDWRNLFRGTSAHNTICVDGRGQATPSGPFSWQNTPSVEVFRWESGVTRDVASATCRGSGFEHWRTVIFEKELGFLLILDRVSAQPEQEKPTNCFERYWHAGQAFRPLGPGVFAIGSHAILVMEDGIEEISILEGTAEGWRSPAYGVKVPAPVLRAGVRCKSPVYLAAVLDFRVDAQARLSRTGAEQWLYERGTESFQIGSGLLTS